MTGKVCPKCDKWKPLDGFHKNRTRPSGRQSYCKICLNKARKENYKKNRERDLKNCAEWYKNNKEHCVKVAAVYRKANKAEIKKASDEYYQNNKDKWRARHYANRDEILKRMRDRGARKRAEKLEAASCVS